MRLAAIERETAHRLDGRELPVLAWRFDAPLLVAATTALGGGLGVRSAAFNAQVPNAYEGSDVVGDLEALAGHLGLPAGETTGMLTAVDVRERVHSEDGGVQVVATVGVTHPAWAAAPPAAEVGAAGTINVLAVVPVRLADAALVNAVATATEAKAQALADADVPGTGTPSDAVAVACVVDGSEHPYGGPRSEWGARLARAAYASITTVLTGGAR
jgi:adenosylcobinamide amidohydrolase